MTSQNFNNPQNPHWSATTEPADGGTNSTPIVVTNSSQNGLTSSTTSDDDDTPDVTVEGGFKLLMGRLKKYTAKIKHPEIFGVDDVDFVFVVKKPQTADEEGVGDDVHQARLTRTIRGSCYEYVDESLADVRLEYLHSLRKIYKIGYQIVKTKSHDFYLIHLSFYHLGLLAEILRYKWQIKTEDKKKVAFKNLTFFKWPIDNIEEFENCRVRANFPPRMRFDLAYNFLLEASVTLRSPQMRPASGCTNCCPATHPPEKTKYALMRVLADKLFDDWMILHTPLPSSKPSPEEKPPCCVTYCPGCLPCVDSCRYSGEELPENCNAKTDKESIRGFLCRFSSLKSAFTKHIYPMHKSEKEAGASFWHIIPIQELVDYVGEKIGFYFAWAELLVMSQVIPALIGGGMFIALLIYYCLDVYLYNTNDDNQTTASALDLVQFVLMKACDNYATPGFALLMIIWGTVFHEVWRRREAWYRFLWNVEDLDVDELQRLRSVQSEDEGGVDSTPDKRSKSRFFFYFLSFFVTLIFVCLVFGSVYSINVINVLSFDYCPSTNQDQSSLSGFLKAQHAIATTDAVICQMFAFAQVMANSISVFFLNLIYTRVCYKLTDWEGHTRESSYTNSLIIKLFVFRFFNVYSILFFTAFASNVLSLKYMSALIGGKSYKGNDGDAVGCGNQSCLLKLTKQLLGILITQPIFNIVAGMVLPSLNAIYQATVARKKPLKRTHGVDDEERPSESAHHRSRTSPILEQELEDQCKLLHLTALGKQQFTADEFTQQIIIFGALLMFSVALPPAPALSIIFMRVDLTLDIRRIVTRYKRPIPVRANGIGVWNDFVNLLTYLGIVTNPLIVVLTSAWGSQFDAWSKFWIFIGFEHLTIILRALVAAAIPDVPRSLEKQTLHRKIIAQQLLDELVANKTK